MSKLQTSISSGTQTYEPVQVAALDVNLRHLYIGTWLLAALNVLHVLWFEVWLSFESPAEQAWATSVVCAHAVMGAAMLLLNPLLRWSYLRSSKPKWTYYVPESVVMLVLFWTVAVTTADIQQGLGLHAYQSACAAVAVVVLLRPWVAVLLLFTAGALLMVSLHLFSIDRAYLNSASVTVVTSTSLALLVSVLLWRRFVQTQLLQQELAQAHALMRQQQAELDTLATTDSLTGLLNRRALMQRAEIEFRRVKRDAVPLSLLLLDIDHFKRVNDQWGHPAGDAVLRQVAQLMRQAVRETDVVARLGGEEFVLLLPGASQAVAQQLAEQLRLHIAARSLSWPEPNEQQGAAMETGENTQVQSTQIQINISISIGVVCLPVGREADTDTLLNLADQALYRAKSLGRNRVEVALLV